MAFDNPVFKMLAHNDTGGAVGHQGGVLIPKDLESYFPPLSQQVTAEEPTVSAYFEADLFDGPRFVGSVTTRYQFQTWGATRSPERRLTSNLGAIRSRASKDDILLIERPKITGGRYRLTLLRKGTSGFQDVRSAARGKRWGFL